MVHRYDVLAMDKNYWVISMVADDENYAQRAAAGGFVALGWREVNLDLSPFLNLEKTDFVEKTIDVFSKAYPDRTKASLASAMSQLYRFLNVIQPGDIIFLRDTENGVFHVGRVESAYIYKQEGYEGTPFQHARVVTWLRTIERTKFSQPFLNAAGSALTLFSISDRFEEIESVMGGDSEEARDLEEFGMEAHLEDFIVDNWSKLAEFKNYQIYKEDGVETGKQYTTQIGRIDILARSLDGKEWLVIELKKGKTSDDVVGQTLRYIGWIQKNEAGKDETVRGLIIAGKEDEKLMYALHTLQNVGFMTYSVQFNLHAVK